MDPRVESSAADIEEQTRYSLACYQAYHELQELYEDIETYKKRGRISPEQLNKIDALLGGGPVGEQDILYGNIVEIPLAQQSIRGLQAQFLFLQNLLQGADAAPTLQSKNAVQRLQNQVLGLKERWEAMQ
jgi:hypothetical protein